MKIFNTLSAKKEEFKPINSGQVGMYVCGPTVYDYGHLGNGRPAVTFDLVRKYFLYKGYNVIYVSNITDIDDKIIQRAALMKITPEELATRIMGEFKIDYASLGIKEADCQPKATDHVEEMIKIIEELEKKGFTYVIDDGVYYDVSKFGDYGKLSKQKMNMLKSGVRVTINSEKKSPHDFVLWKFSKPGEPKWDSKWGEGRPGWHIECSAMSSKYLGDTFDIHGGGADLTFPHHECEIAQSEAFSGKLLANYWMHNGFIQVNNEKMSKSLGNFFTLRDIFKKFDPQVVRFFYLQTHYRSPIDFSDEVLNQSKNALMRLHDFIGRLMSYKDDGKDDAGYEVFMEKNRKEFESAMEDDFETPRALSVIFDLVKEVNRRIDSKTISLSSRETLIQYLRKIDGVLGILFATSNKVVDEDITSLIEERRKARSNRDFKRADEIRKELLEKGILLEDSPEGTTWKKI